MKKNELPRPPSQRPAAEREDRGEAPVPIPWTGTRGKERADGIAAELRRIENVLSARVEKTGPEYIAGMVMKAGYCLSFARVEKALEHATEAVKSQKTTNVISPSLRAQHVFHIRPEGPFTQEELDRHLRDLSFVRGTLTRSTAFWMIPRDGANPTVEEAVLAWGRKFEDIYLMEKGND